MPPTFSGRKDESAAEWVYKMSFALADRPALDTDKKKILFASRYLSGIALHWCFFLLRHNLPARSPDDDRLQLDDSNPNHYSHYRTNWPEVAKYDRFVTALLDKFDSDPFGDHAQYLARAAELKAEQEKIDRAWELRRAKESREQIILLVSLVVAGCGMWFRWPVCTAAIEQCVAWWREVLGGVMPEVAEADRLRVATGGEL